jgi:23S rRNA-/tRNA-specific pseudouridylate synthase
LPKGFAVKRRKLALKSCGLASQRTLIEVRPLTGRTHRIRVHLAAFGFPVLGDVLYGKIPLGKSSDYLALRAIELAYLDPFRNKNVRIMAPENDFVNQFGFNQ